MEDKTWKSLDTSFASKIVLRPFSLSPHIGTNTKPCTAQTPLFNIPFGISSERLKNSDPSIYSNKINLANVNAKNIT